MMILLRLLPAVLLISCTSVTGTTSAISSVFPGSKQSMGSAYKDGEIHGAISKKIYQELDSAVHQAITIEVRNRVVVLIGCVKNVKTKNKILRLAINTEGVKKVVDQITISSNDRDFQNASSDAWITSKVKSHLLLDSEIRSLNYSVKTVNGVVHITGNARNQTEVDRVVNYARKVSGVKKVKCYANVDPGK